MSTLTPSPRLGSYFRRDAPRFLLVGYYDPHGITTVYEYMAEWQATSRFNIEILNLWPAATSPLAIPASVDLTEFDGVILHPTVAYFPENLGGLDRLLATKFKNYDGVKILVKQDEHIRSGFWSQFVVENAFDILVTCVPPDEVHKVYQCKKTTKIVHALTAYVSGAMRNGAAPDFAGRPIDVFYRGSIQPLSLGRLGFEKRKIGYDIQRHLNGSSAALDISSRWEDRISGAKWSEVLQSSKIVLGVESGSNLFDFQGVVESWCKDYATRNKDRDPSSEEYYQQAHEECLHQFEGNVRYGQISPRHFEAAASHAVQVLYEGDYSGIFIPDRHYLALKRDLSNIDEVLGILDDPSRARRLSDAAYEEIILSEKYTYRAYFEQLDSTIEESLIEKGRTKRRPKSKPVPAKSSAPARPKALCLMSHDPVLDPRINWMSDGLVAKDFEVTEIGTYRFGDVGPGPSFEKLSEHKSRLRVERTRHDFALLPSAEELSAGLSCGQQQLLAMLAVLQVPDSGLARLVGALDIGEESRDRFRYLLKHILNTNSALIQAARQTGRFDVVVVADLDVLPAGQVLASEQGAILVYDAHEYWPHSHLGARHWEREYWAQIEQSLCQKADLRITVSASLAKRMTEDYGVAFGCVQNCEPASAAVASDVITRRCGAGETIFLYQGTFAPGRNLEALIQGWAETDGDAILWLRGPDWAYKEELVDIARKTGLLDSRIFFPPPVRESELVSVAAQAHVGLIPYDPGNPAYRYASPNKLSQYMAAGLPILTTPLEDVAKIVRDNGIGHVFSFSDAGSLATEVSRFARSREELLQLSERSRAYFLEQYNWDAVSADFYAKLRELTAGRTHELRTVDELDFLWVDAGRSMRKVAPPVVRPPVLAPPPRRLLLGPLILLAAKIAGATPKSLRRPIGRLLPQRVRQAIWRRMA